MGFPLTPIDDFGWTWNCCTVQISWNFTTFLVFRRQ